MANADIPPGDVFSGIDQLIEKLVRRQQQAGPDVGAKFGELAAALREHRLALPGVIEQFEADCQAQAKKTLAGVAEVLNRLKTPPPPPSAPEPIPVPPVPQLELEDGLGERLNAEFLAFLRKAPTAKPAATPPKRDFSDWAMTSSSDSADGSPAKSPIDDTMLASLVRLVGDRKAIWIALLAAGESTRRIGAPPNEIERTILDAAAHWVVSPTDSTKGAVAAAASKVAADAPEGHLGRAIAKADPNAAATGDEVVQCILASVGRLAKRLPTEVEARDYSRFIEEVAGTVADGKSLWNSGAADAPASPRNMDSWLQSGNASISTGE